MLLKMKVDIKKINKKVYFSSKNNIFNMMNKIPIFNIVLGDAAGLTKMSLVESPAVESDFLAFDKQEPIKFSYNDEEHIVFGCALRADFPIYRFDKVFGEYYVVFTKEVIKQLYEKFMKEGKTADVNLQHSKDTDGVYMIQSFLKDTQNGINPNGFEDISDGSWFCAYKVENEQVWNEVKEGKFNGFSVEVFAELQPVQNEETLETIIDEILENK